MRILKPYPAQFKLMFWGMLISTVGSSMIWPFLMIYVKEKTGFPLTAVASLFTINSITGLLAAFIAGPIADRFGRKGVLVFSLFANGVIYALQSQAHTLFSFAILMGLSGIFNPLYRVGTDAMLADLIPPQKRPDAYALIRLSNNLGVALGPAIGGFVTRLSYTVAFLLAATGLISYSLLMLLFARETIHREAQAALLSESFRGYKHIFRDRLFLLFTASFILVQMCAALMWILLPIYAKTQYQVAENQYGFIPTTNALMVVLLQIHVTSLTKQRKPLEMMALGALFYAIGVASVAFGSGFWGFWISMVIMTIGELIIMPTSSTQVANLAPADMRGRYMSIYGLTWNAAAGIAPLLGGFLSDNLDSRAPWFAGLIIGFLAFVAYLRLSQKSSRIVTI